MSGWCTGCGFVGGHAQSCRFWFATSANRLADPTDHTAAIAEAAREWAKADREVVAAIGQGGPNRWRRWADLNAREKSARAALRAAVDAERTEREGES